MNFIRPSRGLLSRLVCLWFVCFLTSLAWGQTTAPAWLHKQRSGDIVYFTFATPARIERYDLVQGKWLSSIALTDTPAAFAVDADGISVAYGRTVYTRSLDGTNETALYNDANTIRALMNAPGFVVVASGGSSQTYLTTLRRSDRQFVATFSATYAFGGGLAIDPANRRIYGIDTYTSGASTQSVTFNADGTWPSGYPGYQSAGSYYYTSANQPRSFVSPDGAILILGAGYVYDPVSLTYRASLAGVVNDLAFVGNDVPVVLRDSKLVAYSNTFLESGSATLAKTAQGIAYNAGQVFAFSADAIQASGIAVEKVVYASFSTAVPGAPIDPSSLDFIPDKVIPAGNDTFWLYSKTNQSVFLWSAADWGYAESLRIHASADYMAYSEAGNRLYFGYSTGEIWKLDLAAESPVEQPFANLPAAAMGLQTAGSVLFTVDSSGSWETYTTFNASGTKIASQDWNDYSRELVWSPLRKRMFHFRDGTSPNDLEYNTINTDGTFGTAGETPYHGTYTITPPIRLSTDETGVLIGSGVVFDATTLVYAGSLANPIIDAVSVNNRWHTIRLSGTETQLQIWSQNLLFERGLTVPGYPHRILSLADGRLLVMTSTGASTATTTSVVNTGRLIYSIVNLAGDGTVTTSPYITSQPASATVYRGKPATLSVAAGGTGAFTYQWYKGTSPIEGATSASYVFTAVADTDAGSYRVKVTSPYGTLTSTTATLTVQAPPPAPVITTQPVSKVISLSSTSSNSLSVGVTGTLLTYQWYKDGQPINLATSSSLSLYPFNADRYGSYQVVVSNPGGSVTSSAAVVSPPPAPTIASNPQSTYALAGQSVTFSVSATSLDLTYVWRFNGQPLGALSSSSLTIIAGDPTFGSYDVVVSNNAGSATSTAATLTRAVPASIVSQPAPSAVLLGGDTTFSVQAAGAPGSFTYRWQRYSPSTGTWVNIVSDLYYYSGVTSSTLLVTNATALMDGLLFRCSVTNGVGSTVYSSPALLDVETTPPVDALAFTLQPVDKTVSAGASVAFAVATNSIIPPALQWYRDGVALPGETGSILVLSNVTAADEGNYTVLAQRALEVVVSQPGRLTVLTGAAPQIETAANQLTGALGQSLVLSGTVSGQPAPTLVWSKDGTPISGVFVPVLSLSGLKLSDAGVYRLTATNVSGSAFVEILVSVRPPTPKAPGWSKVYQGQKLAYELGSGSPVQGLLYRASGLPKGVVLNATTGALSGSVTAGPGTYAAAFWTEFSGQRSEVVASPVTVAGFPADFVGSYEGLFRTQTGETRQPCALVTLTVTAKGQYTGTLRTSTALRPFALKGNIVPEEGGATALAMQTLSDGTVLGLTLSVESDGTYLSGIMNRPGYSDGVLDATARLGNVSARVASAAGSYTIALGLPQPVDDGEVVVPAGLGYATATLAKTGTLAITGRLGDGRVLTASLSSALPFENDGSILYRLFVRPHAAGENYLGGTFRLAPEPGVETPRYRVAPVDGTQEVYWKKSAQPAEKAYAAGFGPALVDVTMAPWKVPAVSQTLSGLLGAPSANAPAYVFSDADTRLPDANAALGFDLKLDSKLRLLAVPSAAGWSAKVNAKTGLVTGQLTLPVATDGNGTVTQSRTVLFNGVLFQTVEGGWDGLGVLSYQVPVSGTEQVSGSLYLNWIFE